MKLVLPMRKQRLTTVVSKLDVTFTCLSSTWFTLSLSTSKPFIVSLFLQITFIILSVHFVLLVSPLTSLYSIFSCFAKMAYRFSPSQFTIFYTKWNFLAFDFISFVYAKPVLHFTAISIILKHYHYR